MRSFNGDIFQRHSSGENGNMSLLRVLASNENLPDVGEETNV